MPQRARRESSRPAAQIRGQGRVPYEPPLVNHRTGSPTGSTSPGGAAGESGHDGTVEGAIANHPAIAARTATRCKSDANRLMICPKHLLQRTDDLAFRGPNSGSVDHQLHQVGVASSAFFQCRQRGVDGPLIPAGPHRPDRLALCLLHLFGYDERLDRNLGVVDVRIDADDRPLACAKRFLELVRRVRERTLKEVLLDPCLLYTSPSPRD